MSKKLQANSRTAGKSAVQRRPFKNATELRATVPKIRRERRVKADEKMAPRFLESDETAKESFNVPSPTNDGRVLVACKKHRHLIDNLRMSRRNTTCDRSGLIPFTLTSTDLATKSPNMAANSVSKQETDPIASKDVPSLASDYDVNLRKRSSEQAFLNPFECRAVVTRFQKMEIIEEENSKSNEEDKMIMQIIHKSRTMGDETTVDHVAGKIKADETPLVKYLLEQMCDNWSKTIKIWSESGYLGPYPLFDIVQMENDEVIANKMISKAGLPSDVNDDVSLDERAAAFSPDIEHYEIARDESESDNDNNNEVINYDEKSEAIQQYLAKRGPSYQETITTQLRYNFRRRKRFYPVYLMQHVREYNRPPFWNYSRKYGSFNVLLNKHQLENLYELANL